ncbi:hypothetical protein INT45_006756 [Circinella minor]|uniref:Fanconi anaemia group A protein helical domain-containing protein n=1 Tax=Circinella minor TaxID=1195481 RepID=A0A8H7SA22_9FUNG|nr:hypothetical protein INT45_006756 [Circinella minor]
MFGLYMIICQRVAQACNIGEAANMLEKLNDAAVDIITNGFRDKERMSIILTMVQLLLLHTSEMLGLKYPKWFDQMFIDPNSTHINTTRMGQQFLLFLESLAICDTPTVLQMHGKALQGNRNLPVQRFISLVKTRLMELGLDQSLRTHPTSLHHPVQVSTSQYFDSVNRNTSATVTAALAYSNNSNGSNGHASGTPVQQENTVEVILTTFKETGLIPKSLLEDSIFRPLWFKVTFLPSLIQWQNSNKNELEMARDQLIQALRDRKRIPDEIYMKYLKNKK